MFLPNIDGILHSKTSDTRCLLTNALSSDISGTREMRADSLQKNLKLLLRNGSTGCRKFSINKTIISINNNNNKFLLSIKLAQIVNWNTRYSINCFVNWKQNRESTEGYSKSIVEYLIALSTGSLLTSDSFNTYWFIVYTEQKKFSTFVITTSS